MFNVHKTIGDNELYIALVVDPGKQETVICMCIECSGNPLWHRLRDTDQS